MAETDNYTPEQQLVRVAATIDQPDKFAKIFCEAAKSQKVIDEVLKACVLELIKKDADARESIKALLKEVSHDDWRAFVRKIGTPAWAILLLVVGAIFEALSKKYLG